MFEAYFVTLTDICSFSIFALFFWSTRDHSSLVKSTYEEHMFVVAMTSSERGIHFHLLAFYFLV